MKMLGLNPMEQEIVDLTNEITRKEILNNCNMGFSSPLYHRNGFIYFPEFCAIVNKKLREEDEEVFRQNMFKVLIDYVDDGRIKGAAVTMTFTSNSTSLLSLSLSNRLISSDLVRH